MSKIMRRMFLGAALSFGAVMFWGRSWLARPRAYVAGLRRRFHRWRTGMQPRWHEVSSTRFYRGGSGGMPGVPGSLANQPFKTTDTWEVLSWPDNGEVVERTVTKTTLEYIELDLTEGQAAGGIYVGGVEWHEREMGSRLPGPKCATPEEFIDKVRHAAKYELEPNPDGDSEISARNRWIGDAKATVERWNGELPSGPLVDELWEKLNADALPMIERGQERDKDPDVYSGARWGVFKLGRFEV